MTIYRPPEFDEAMVEPPATPKAPQPGTDAYYDAMGAEIDEQPIGVPHRKRRISGPLD